MTPIKTLERESYFLATIFSKTLILFSKTHTQPLSIFFFFLQIKKLSSVSSEVETIFQNWFLKNLFQLKFVLELWLSKLLCSFDYFFPQSNLYVAAIEGLVKQLQICDSKVRWASFPWFPTLFNMIHMIFLI